MTTFRLRDRKGFTLTELLMVMMVMTILYCIALSAIRAVDRTARKTAARAELKSIETALKQYYTHYQNWPGSLGDNASAGSDSGDTIIDATLAGILNGSNDGGRDRDNGGNPDKLVFIEFSLTNKDDEPLNPWGASGRYEKQKCHYHVAVDADGDNYVLFSPNQADFNNAKANAVSLLPSDRRYRGNVIVWTYNPELSKDNEDYLIGSWQ